MTTKSSKSTPAGFPLTLDEFCTRRSASDSRVELIGGFHFDERSKGNVKDTEENFAARLDAYSRRTISE